MFFFKMTDMFIVTKTDNDHKRPQTTTNQQQMNMNNTNHTQTTTKYQQTNTNYQKMATNSHLCISNQKCDISFILPALGNYKEHPNFEKHTLHSAK